MMKTLTHHPKLSKNLPKSQPQVVVYSDAALDTSVLRFLERTMPLSKFDIHYISRSSGSQHDQLTVQVKHSVRKQGDYQISFDATQTADALLAKCGPGRTDDLLARYSKRIGADLVIVPMLSDRLLLWTNNIAERLARHFPVLAVPTGAAIERTDLSSRPLRWLVPLEGSIVAESILGPLSSLTNWLASEVTLIQPLDLASGWSDRIVSDPFATSSKLAPSIGDSTDYLMRCARHKFTNAQVRVCCTTGSDAVSSILHLADSSTIDAVAIGLSNRWPISRYLTAELNELVLRRVRKPILLFEPGSS